ncbi:MAG: RES domain-containing protein, partial [Betaproteobacteria bacterium]|nr:RES domain-containing protein [Betaproteobacteria bacterium]
MIIWRICPQRYAGEAFSGKGAAEGGGRWNLPGHRVVYASETLSLAALEYCVNVDAEDVPAELVAVAAEIPAAVRMLCWREE